ncbi:UNVERIFIED_ORG: SNF2 family DNA or RNA helicase [Arthrobacter sp. UYCu721]
MPITMPDLLPHQALIKQYIIDHPHCGIFLGVGGGKTLTVLHSLASIRPSGHILVVAPVNIARSTWINEIEKWGIPIRTRSLIVNDNDKKLSRAKRLARYAEVFTDPPTMYFLNQELVKDLVDNMPMLGTGRNKVFQWPFQTVIVDESQGVKNPSSERFKALKQARPAIIRLIELTGTPTPNGLLDLWSQVYLLDQGLALGETMTSYKQKYFRVTKYANNRPIEWEPLSGAEEEIYARVAHLVMSTENTSITLPKATIEDVNISMTKDELEAYRDFKRDLVLDLAAENPGEPLITIVAKNQAVLTNKLVQFAAGTMYTDEHHNYRVIHDHKIQMTDYLIRNTDGPVILTYMFRSDRAEQIDKLTALGHDVRPFDGSRAMVKEWNEGKVPIMLLHPASAGHGLNLQDGGNTLIWYTVPYSLEHYIQTNGRLDRMGQKKPVTIYRLITKGTHDTRLPMNLEKKALIQDGLISAVHVDAAEVTELVEEFSDLYEASLFSTVG